MPTHYALSKYVKIFESVYLIIRDKAIISKLCIEFGKKSCFVCKFINIYLNINRALI